MNRISLQSVGLLAWDGTAATPRDVRKWNYFTFDFEVTADIATDAVFNIMYADPTEADPCLPGPLQPVPEVTLCDSLAEPGPQATITIPAGTVAGQVCSGTIPCKPGAFIALAAASGDTANVTAVLRLVGPR